MATQDPTPATTSVPAPPPGPAPSSWRRLHVGSALAGVVVLAMGNIVVGPDPVFLVFAGLWLGAILLTRRRARLGTVITTVLALVAALFGSGDSVYIASHPIAFYGAEGALFTLLALAGATNVIAALGLLLERRAAWLQSRAIPLAVVGIAVAAVVAATVAGARARSGLTDVQVSVGDLRLDAKETKFSTGSLTATGQVTIFITNSDPSYHTFTIDGVVDEQLTPHSSHRVTLKLAPGKYRYYCTVPGHADDMSGTLVIH
jgi:plastocyanin